MGSLADPPGDVDWRENLSRAVCPGHTQWAAVFTEHLLALVEDPSEDSWSEFERSSEEWVKFIRIASFGGPRKTG